MGRITATVTVTNLSKSLLGYLPLEQAGIVVDRMRHRLLQVDAFDLKSM